MVDEALITKAALINQFCSEVVASGLVIPADQMSAEECYEVISYQAKSKVQVYTFMKLLFGNSNIDTEIKMKFMRGLQRLDAEGIKDLDDILDRQGGFTQQAAERHRKDFGGYEDRDAILELGCLAMLPQIDHKKKMFNDFLNTSRRKMLSRHKLTAYTEGFYLFQFELLSFVENRQKHFL